MMLYIVQLEHVLGESDGGCKSTFTSLVMRSENKEDGAGLALTLSMLVMGYKNEEDGAGLDVILSVLNCICVLGSSPFIGWRLLNYCLVWPFSVATLL